MILGCEWLYPVMIWVLLDNGAAVNLSTVVQIVETPGQVQFMTTRQGITLPLIWEGPAGVSFLDWCMAEANEVPE